MKTLYLFSLVAFIVSCSGNKASTDTSESTEDKQEAEMAESTIDAKTEANEMEAQASVLSDTDLKRYLGYYVGAFKADKYQGEYLYSYYNKVNISIDSFGKSTLFGHSVVAGNDRPFKGSYTFGNGAITATCEEPGDDQYDGVFKFRIELSGKINGTWVANNSKLTVYQRKYELSKKQFAYNPENDLDNSVSWIHLYNGEDGDGPDGEFITEDATKFNPSTDSLKAEDIENMYKGDLQIMRNSIYARHGYSFKTRKMRYIFDKYVDWYIPVSTDVRDEITDLEWANIELLKRYEDHADEYYDSFGR